MYKVSKSLPPPQITELFAQRIKHPNSLRHNAKFLQPFVNFVCCGTESISYLGPKIWGMVIDTYKNIDSLYNFRNVMHACMYVCMYVCMYLCMYVCMYVCM